MPVRTVARAETRDKMAVASTGDGAGCNGKTCLPVRQSLGAAKVRLMRVGILTSVDTRHRYFVNTLRARVDVVAIGYEQTGYHPADTAPKDLSPVEARIVADHFADRDRQEATFFGHDAEFVRPSAACGAFRIEAGSLNTKDTCERLTSADVETVVVYGTNLIKPPLLGQWPRRMINMHLGLSPYYRGTATNFYPLLNEEPEYVGATIHLIDAGIDSGAIVHHARPIILPDDTPHTIGCKAILVGLEKMVTALEALECGKMEAVSQWSVPDARLYLRKDYHPHQVVTLYRLLNEGLIPKYAARAEAASARLRLID